MRPDLVIIEQWIAADSRVLDLGCGDGALLRHLKNSKNVTGYGLEISHKKINECIAHDVSVIQADLNGGTQALFSNNSFDYVVMSQTLQALDDPSKMLDEMLRMGKQAIVAFPNMGYWTNRFHLGIIGRMPMSKSLPHKWYNTPNIHLCTLNDFELLCAEKGVIIRQREIVDYRNGKAGSLAKKWPNLFAEVAIYHLEKTL